MTSMKVHRLIVAMLVGTSGLLLTTGTASFAAEQGAARIAERLQRLEDIESIRVLLDHYIEVNESRDYAAYSRLFARQGELVLRRGRATGPAGIEEMLVKNYGTPGSGPAVGSMHLLSNVSITVDADAAVATSRWTLVVPGDNSSVRLGGMGRYRDKLVREDGVWKFSQRIVSIEIPVPTPAQ